MQNDFSPRSNAAKIVHVTKNNILSKPFISLTKLIYQIKAATFKECPCNNKESETVHQILICQARKIDAKREFVKEGKKIRKGELKRSGILKQEGIEWDKALRLF
jgi:hypothetical protein